MQFEQTELGYGMNAENAPFATVQRHENLHEHTNQLTVQHQSLYHEKLSHKPFLNYIYNSFKNSTLFRELNRYTVREFVERQDKVLLIWILCDCEQDDQMDWDLKDLEKHVTLNYATNSIQWVYIHQSEAEFFKLGDRFQIEAVPTLIIDNIPRSGISNEKYVFEDPTTGLQGFRPRTSLSDVMEFLDRFLRGTLQMVVQSEEPHPMPKAGEVWHVVGSNFVPLVLDNDKDILLLVYSPYCTACVAVLPIFKDLAAALKDVSDLVIATLDKTKNDLPVRGFPLHFYPTVLFFPGNNKEKHVDFRDFLRAHRDIYFDEEGLVKFLRAHATVPIAEKDVVSLVHALEEKESEGTYAKVLTPDNFDNIVFDKTKDVVVLIHAPWCPHCVRFYPTFQKLAEELHTDNNIVIAQLDGSKHRQIGDKYHQGFPTVLMFSQNNKVRPIKFAAARSLPILVQWCRDHRESESILPAQKHFRVFYNGDKIRWYKYHQDAYFERETVVGEEGGQAVTPQESIPPQVAASPQEAPPAESTSPSSASTAAQDTQLEAPKNSDKSSSDPTSSIVWKEYENGKVKAQFAEESYDTTSQIAIIFDASRGMHVKLTAHNVAWSPDRKIWHEFDKGEFYGGGISNNHK